MPGRIERSEVRTRDGWSLPLFRAVPADRPPTGPPVLLVPGYGMNSHLFRFHPEGGSMSDALRDAGLDPWAVDLRGASTTRPPRRGAPVRLADMAFQDLPAAVDHVREVTGHAAVHAIGCSLGGSLLYAWVAAADRPRVDRLVAMGSPLRWAGSRLHRAFAATAPLTSAFPLRGSRMLARAALPIAARFFRPALGIYLNPAITRLDRAADLVLTVEDPIPSVNREIAAWMRARDLRLDGVDVTAGLGRFDRPLLVVTADGDGICDRASALSAVGATRGPVTVLEVGHPSGERVGHADLFVHDRAAEQVWRPIIDFLRASAPGGERCP